jgi:hypothetical protein
MGSGFCQPALTLRQAQGEDFLWLATLMLDGRVKPGHGGRVFNGALTRALGLPFA